MRNKARILSVPIFAFTVLAFASQGYSQTASSPVEIKLSPTRDTS